MPKDQNLQPGFVIDGYTIQRQLGEGAFGSVFAVADQTGSKFAMKLEKQSKNSELHLLKMEIAVLKAVKNRDFRHFCRLEGRGKFAHYNYIVITLVEKSIEQLRRESGERMELKKSIALGSQALEAIEELHSIGYLHRDVKPANFAEGKNNIIYILDFGMSRQFSDGTGIKPPRSMVGFRGTVRYASISCHLRLEQSRKDDIESWFYMQVELTVGQLPWRHLHNEKDVCQMKQRMRKTAEELFFSYSKSKLIKILRYIDALLYYDEPGYSKIQEWLAEENKHKRLKEKSKKEILDQRQKNEVIQIGKKQKMVINNNKNY